VTTSSVLEQAKQLASLGFNPLPTRRGKKSPGVESWKKYQRERTDSMVETWWGTGSGYVGIWTATGAISGLVVLDCDSAEAETFWRGLIGAEMEATTCVKTAKGHHYWFSIGPGQKVDSWAYHEGDISFDVKAEGGGVMTPPSPHPFGGFYSWVREPASIFPCPSLLLDKGRGALARLKGESGKDDHGDPTDGQGAEDAGPMRTLLEQLLNNPPSEGGRNEWLIRVAGHLAKMMPFEDAYHAMVKQMNKSLKDPLSDAEVRKTANSAWEMEQTKGPDTIANLRAQGIVSGEPDSVNGWLVGSGAALLCPAMVGEGETKHEALVAWADFDIKTLGIIRGGENTDYLVELCSAYGALECKVSGKILGSTRDLTVWLAERRVSVMPPPKDMNARQSVAGRLLRYINSQDAPVYSSVDALGWSDEVSGFICHEGIITAGATQSLPFGDVRPAPILSEWAPYHYGFAGTRAGAKAVLAEVMTFHDEEVCAVYGAWWAACFLKEQIVQRTALFPFMALEAPSESGKTTGFFSLMMQLSGNREGHGEYTMAVLRDRVSAHKNGPVWIDDMSDPAQTLDLIRQATSGGSRSKKGENRHSQETVTLVAPIVMSAEGLQALSTEKALSDRAIKLTVPSPVGRVSLNDPTRPQWDDITDLQLQWQRNLTQMAGHFCSMALECLPMVEGLQDLRPAGGGGRFNDSMAIVRLGSRVLVELGADPRVVATVDEWVDNRTTIYDPNANLLTQAVLPWAWRDLGYPQSSNNGVVVFLDRDGYMWYREEAMADAWAQRHNLTARERQLGSLESLRDQRRRLGIEGKGTNKRTAPGGNPSIRYQRLPLDASRAVREAAGWLDDDEGRLL
jgi:hypothetical protein